MYLPVNFYQVLQSDFFIQLPEEEPSLSHRKKGVSDPSLSSEVSSWFDQVSLTERASVVCYEYSVVTVKCTI